MTIFLYDVLHLSYNLLYPAILGTFIYDMAHGGNANSAFLSVIWERKMVVLFLYTMDFTVAKKIYASHSRFFTKVKLWASVVAEILTLITLWLSFWNANNPRVFYACIVVFILAGA